MITSTTTISAVPVAATIRNSSSIVGFMVSVAARMIRCHEQLAFPMSWPGRMGIEFHKSAWRLERRPRAGYHPVAILDRDLDLVALAENPGLDSCLLVRPGHSRRCRWRDGDGFRGLLSFEGILRIAMISRIEIDAANYGFAAWRRLFSAADRSGIKRD